MRWHRRFANRVEIELNNEEFLLEGLGQNGINTVLARIEEAQSRLQNSPNQSAKLEQRREVALQKRVCIFICTVLPLLTLLATLFRLWLTGFFSSPPNSGCHPGWYSIQNGCYAVHSTMRTFSESEELCRRQGGSLPKIRSQSEKRLLVSLLSPPFWLARAPKETTNHNHPQSESEDSEAEEDSEVGAEEPRYLFSARSPAAIDTSANQSDVPQAGVANFETNNSQSLSALEGSAATAEVNASDLTQATESQLTPERSAATSNLTQINATERMVRMATSERRVNGLEAEKRLTHECRQLSSSLAVSSVACSQLRPTICIRQRLTSPVW